MYKHQWKRAQALADTFWARWQKEYLNMLQHCRKWKHNKPDLKEADIVLLMDKQQKRNEWPVGVIVKILPSGDGVVRKMEGHDKTKTFYKPILDHILLLSPID